MSEEMPFWCVVGLGVLLTFMLAVTPFPESVLVTSADGAVRGEGVARQSQALSLIGGDDAEIAFPLVSSAYTLTARAPLEVPVTLVFDAQAFGVDPALTALYRWSDDMEMWTFVSDDERVQATQSGRYALGLLTVVDAPIFLSAYDALRAAAPMGTRGYEIDVGYSVNDGPVLHLAQVGERGGCDGVFGSGNREERSVLTTAAMTAVDDVQTMVTYHFSAHWIVEENGEACVLHYTH